MSAPTVSFIVAAWKAERFLERAVGSALASTDVSVEVIVVDDASPDGTFALAQRLAAADSRVVADRLPVNGGPSVARNRAIALSRGSFVAVLDADDAVDPNRIAALVRHAEVAKVDIVVDNMIEVNEAGERLGSRGFLVSPEFANDREIDLATWITFNRPMTGSDCIGYLKPLFRRDALPACGTAYDWSLRNSEDYYLVASLLAQGKLMAYLASPGYFYTRSAGSTSHRLKPEHTRAWLEAESRFAAAYGAQFSGNVRKTAAKRLRVLRNVHQLIATTDAVKTRRLGKAISVLASDTRGAIYTLSVFVRIAIGKVLRRKLV